LPGYGSLEEQDRSDIVAFLVLLGDDVKIALPVIIPLDSR
jgi:hypothetical protein